MKGVGFINLAQKQTVSASTFTSTVSSFSEFMGLYLDRSAPCWKISLEVRVVPPGGPWKLPARGQHTGEESKARKSMYLDSVARRLSAGLLDCLPSESDDSSSDDDDDDDDEEDDEDEVFDHFEMPHSPYRFAEVLTLPGPPWPVSALCTASTSMLLMLS